jgi:hypothetical protein
MKRSAMASMLFSSLSLLHGCGPIKADPDMITVASDPAGATVYAMGKAIGTTPMVIRQEVVFPLTYSPEKRDLYGTILLHKEGCQDHKQVVSTADYRYGIKAKLDCGQNKNKGESIEQRLRQLKDLHEKGLITDEEEKATRKRIMDSL